MKRFHWGTPLASSLLVVALILTASVYTALGAYRDYQALLLGSRIAKSMRPMMAAKNIVEANIGAGMSNPCQSIQHARSDTAEISCHDGRITSRITLPEIPRPIVLVLFRHPGSTEWHCTSSENERYIPLACRPYDA